MSYAATPLSLIQLVQLKASTKKRRATLSPRLDNSKSNSTDPPLNLSVLRFTLGNSLTLSLLRYTCVKIDRFIGWCRNTWPGRVLLTQMDRLRVRFIFGLEPFCWFCFTYSTAACKKMKSFSSFV